jgi:ABC-2 type transport system permease protein
LASGWFKKVKRVDPYKTANPADLLISGKAEAVLVAPKEGLAYAFARGGKNVQLLINAANAARAQQVEGYVKLIVLQAAAGESPALLSAPLIELDVRVMFNHYMVTSYFMIPAIVVMSMYVVILIVCSMSIAKEKEIGTMEKLLASPATTLEILAGKLLPYFIIGFIIITFMLTVGVLGFGMPLRGHLWQAAVNSVIFIMFPLSLAVLTSSAASNQQQAMMGSALFVLMGVLMGGVFFPVENIPAALRWISYFNPIMYSAANFRNLVLKGGDLAYFWQYCGASFLICFLLALAGYKNFKSKLN